MYVSCGSCIWVFNSLSVSAQYNHEPLQHYMCHVYSCHFCEVLREGISLFLHTWGHCRPLLCTSWTPLWMGRTLRSPWRGGGGPPMVCKLKLSQSLSLAVWVGYGVSKRAWCMRECTLCRIFWPIDNFCYEETCERASGACCDTKSEQRISSRRNWPFSCGWA